jgi:deoxyribonuclease V
MKVARFHEWDLEPGRAAALQRELGARVRLEPLGREVRLVAGVDVGVKGETATAAVVVLGFPGLELREVRRARQRVRMPYVPGLLSFRECPVAAAACAELELEPDLVLVDGQGIAHPRRLGIAAHLGLLLDRPAVGCAKSRLCGRHGEPGPERGARVPLLDGEEVIGAVLRTRARVRPLYVSPGHRITLEEAVRHVLACGRGYRLPEPTRLAHQAAAGTLRWEEEGGQAPLFGGG